MTSRRLAMLSLALFALLVPPALALDDIDDDEEMEAPPPPPPKPLPPPPPPTPPPPPVRVVPPEPPRAAPPPRPEPPREVIRSRYEPTGFYFAPEILALQFDVGELEYGTDMNSGDLLSVEDDAHDLGWRLGLGYRWRNHWDFVARGTDVDTTDAEGATASSPTGIATTFGAGFDTAQAEMDVDYTTIEAEAGYRWGEWERSHARLFFGPRFASIRQGLTTTHDPDASVGGDGITTRESTDMEAIGLHAGLEGAIAFSRHWALILRGGVGAYDASFDDDIVRWADDGTVTAASSSADDDTITSLDAALALRWQRRAFADGMFAIRFGWEIEHWNDVPSPRDVAATSGPAFRGDDFSANGPFLRLEWVF